MKLGLVAQAYSPSYIGGWNEKDYKLRNSLGSRVSKLKGSISNLLSK